jgi:hypothetical protein
MSLLPSVASSWAFNEKPIEVYEMEDLYTPFSEFSREKPESLVTLLKKSRQLYVIEGSRGDGKSCFLRYLTSKLYSTDIFTMLLDTFGSPDYTDPNLLAKSIIGGIYKAIETYGKVDKKTREYVFELMASKVTFEKGKESNFALKIGGWFSVIPQILRIGSEANKEIRHMTKTILEQEYFLSERVRCMDDLVECITKGTGFSNLALLIDGIDHMNVADVAKFSENNFTWLARVNCSVAITALSEYRAIPAYTKNTDCARTIGIPRIASIEGLKSFLNKRIKALDSHACWDSVCEEASTKLLFEWYTTRPALLTLRKLMRSLNYAASAALNEGSSKILPYHMSIGIRDSL